MNNGKHYIIASIGTSSIGIVQRALEQAQSYRTRIGERAPLIKVVAFDTSREIERITSDQLSTMIFSNLNGDGSGMNLDHARRAFSDDTELIRQTLLGGLDPAEIGGAIALMMPGVGATATALGCPLAKLLRDDLGITTIPMVSWPSHSTHEVTEVQFTLAEEMRAELFRERFTVFQANMDYIYGQPDFQNILYTQAVKKLQQRLANEIFTLFNFWHEGRFTDPNDLKNQFLAEAGYLKVAIEAVNDSVTTAVQNCFDQNLYQFEGRVRACAVYMRGAWTSRDVSEMLNELRTKTASMGLHPEFRLKKVPPPDDEAEENVPKTLTLFLSSVIDVPQTEQVINLRELGGDGEIPLKELEGLQPGYSNGHAASMPLQLAPGPVTPRRQIAATTTAAKPLSVEAKGVYLSLYASTKILDDIGYQALFVRANSAEGTTFRRWTRDEPRFFQNILTEIRAHLGDKNPEQYQEKPSWKTVTHALALKYQNIAANTGERGATIEINPLWLVPRYLGVSSAAWAVLEKGDVLARIYEDTKRAEDVSFETLVRKVTKGNGVGEYILAHSTPQTFEELARIIRAALSEGQDIDYSIEKEGINVRTLANLARLKQSINLAQAWLDSHADMLAKNGFPGFREKPELIPGLKVTVGQDFTLSPTTTDEEMNTYLRNVPGEGLSEKIQDHVTKVEICLYSMQLHGRERYRSLWTQSVPLRDDTSVPNAPGGLLFSFREKARTGLARLHRSN